MLFVFAITIGLGAALLFAVQPMAAKWLLPTLGGSPAVWNTAMVVFQTLLLLGYVYAHTLARVRSWRARLVVHGCVLAMPALALPIALPGASPPGTGDPAWWTIRTLVVMCGLPFFAVASAGPLLQRWFADSGHARSAHPYFLFAASNAGSAIGLLAYPFVIERAADLPTQGAAWSIVYGAFCALTLSAGALAWRRGGRIMPDRSETHAPVTNRDRARWLLLAAVPSALLLGVAQHATTDIAAVPLLWIAPLALYLATFVVAFARPLPTARLGRIAALGAIALSGAFLLEAREPIGVLLAMHLGGFALLTLLCHARLAETRPGASRLTEFYLFVALGGVVGGAAVALLAPVLFDRVLEYPLAIAAALLARPGTRSGRGLALFAPLGVIGLLLVGRLVQSDNDAIFTEAPKLLERAIAVGLPCIACVLVIGNRRAFAAVIAVVLVYAVGVQPAVRRDVVLTERTFFGVHEVRRSGALTSLVHGTTVHGAQYNTDELRRVPLSYYHPAGPVGDVFQALASDGRRRWGVVGLGAGAVLAYADADDHVRVFEIDPTVVRIARNPELFTFYADAVVRGAHIETVLGDGRLTVASAIDDPAFTPLDLLIVDAFTSDAIPLHLLSIEAVAGFADALAPRGVLLYHVSNRHLDLVPMLGRIAQELGMAAVVCHALPDAEMVEIGVAPSTWVLLTPSSAEPVRTRGDILRTGTWSGIDLEPGTPLWTDRSSNVLDAWR